LAPLSLLVRVNGNREVPLGAVSAAEHRAREAGLDWGTVEGIDDEALDLAIRAIRDLA
jgi:hypothetical protein